MFYSRKDNDNCLLSTLIFDLLVTIFINECVQLTLSA